ncbi:HAD-IIB family hydrolase [Mycoplasmopsis opalescens]|uniref:HAD-IIB family hydrolase n=1 Tax=Mycoplasmopsis opalescens TaxID=114886 RepID=UPI0004A6D9F3|nr:HAD family hydrolase [Mycoplasmopsis opalescens]
MSKKINELNFDIKAYFFDLDGTVVDLPEEEKQISDENIQALQNLVKNKKVTFSTGRGYNEFTKNLALKIGCEHLITLNGAQIYNPNTDELIKEFSMDYDQSVEMISYFIKRNLYFLINGERIIYHQDQSRNEFMRSWVDKCTFKTFDEIPHFENFKKLLVFGLDEIGTQKLMDELSQKYPNFAFHLVSRGYSIEITHKDANKGNAASIVCSLSNINIRDAVHVGDSGNDTYAAGILGALIIMDNAIDSAKNKADYIGTNYKNAGISKLINILETK